MTATHAEIVRALPPELAAEAVIAEGHIRGPDGARRWEIALAPEGSRRLGAITLTVTEVAVRLWGYPEAERARFIARFELCARRGGG